MYKRCILALSLFASGAAIHATVDTEALKTKAHNLYAAGYSQETALETLQQAAQNEDGTLDENDQAELTKILKQVYESSQEAEPQERSVASSKTLNDQDCCDSE